MSAESDYIKRAKNRQLKGEILLANIKRNMSDIDTLLEKYSSHWGYEDPIYRFYHYSFKVHRLQHDTQQIYDLLLKLSPHPDGEGIPLCDLFTTIMKDGAAGVEFDIEHNQDWAKHCRPFVEAFFHAKFFLEMVAKYGKEYEETVELLDSGWAAVLELYGIR